MVYKRIAGHQEEKSTSLDHQQAYQLLPIDL
jgi:hypothetical protein